MNRTRRHTLWIHDYIIKMLDEVPNLCVVHIDRHFSGYVDVV